MHLFTTRRSLSASEVFGFRIVRKSSEVFCTERLSNPPAEYNPPGGATLEFTWPRAAKSLFV